MIPAIFDINHKYKSLFITSIKQYDNNSPLKISFDNYRLVDSLKRKYDIAENEADDINSFLCSNATPKNSLMNILLDIANEINRIDSSIKISLKLINTENYPNEEFLEISPKVTNFNDIFSINDLSDDLIDKYPSEYIDKIVISMEFP